MIDALMHMICSLTYLIDALTHMICSLTYFLYALTSFHMVSNVSDRRSYVYDLLSNVLSFRSNVLHRHSNIHIKVLDCYATKASPFVLYI
jgi:hypothetical protein